MEQNETKTSQDKSGSQIETDKPSPDRRTRQAADDKSKHDADENLPEDKKHTPETGDTKQIDELVQGKKLEEKYRGGDTTDADEIYSDL